MLCWSRVLNRICLMDISLAIEVLRCDISNMWMLNFSGKEKLEEDLGDQGKSSSV